RNKFGRRLQGRLRELAPGALAEVLIGGILKDNDGSGELPSFDLVPVPNYFFTRDPQVVLGGGVVICGMATQARRREALLSKYVFEHHTAFRDDARFRVDFMEGPRKGIPKRDMPTLEGGDLLVASEDLLIVGLTERTNKKAVTDLATSLREVGAGLKTILAVELPRQRSFMHLDTVFTFTSRNECLIYPPVILPGGSQAATVTTIDLTKKGISYTPQKSLLGTLKKRGFAREPIYCGGRSAVDQQREQWTDGANAFTLAPGIILLY